MFEKISIKELQKYTFYIPRYQRGYRWGTEHIIRLLEDLYDFHKMKKNKDADYCLQPISVKSVDNKIEVVDGQQRLISVFLILKAFNINNQKLFKLEFERDNDSSLRKDFINNIETPKNDDGCIDLLFMKNTYNVTKKWLEIKAENQKDNMLEVDLLPILTNAFILWYEIDKNDNAYEVFSNLNSGKIKLTDSELIKALLLSIYSDEKTGINEAPVVARLWDEMGRTLNNDLFWGFIQQSKTKYSKDDIYQTRIDYLFKIYNDKHKKADNMSDDIPVDELTREVKNELTNENKSGFRWYEWKFKNEQNAREIWDGIRNIFRILQDWYRNTEYYNYVGLAIDCGVKISKILDWYTEKTKTEFVRKLKETVCGELINKQPLEDYLRGLQYGQDHDDEIKKVLKIFNIITCCNEGERFNFIVKGGWSIEHLFAQSSEIIDKKERNEWLDDHLKLLSVPEYDDLYKIIKDSVDKDLAIEDDEFKILSEKLNSTLMIETVDIHGLGNLALLGKNDNSTLGNRAFYIKRKHIIDMMQDKTGKSNIPLATKWAFLKRYSGISDDFSGYTVNFIMWNKDDSEAYFNEILHKLSELIKEVS